MRWTQALALAGVFALVPRGAFAQDLSPTPAPATRPRVGVVLGLSLIHISEPTRPY